MVFFETDTVLLEHRDVSDEERSASGGTETKLAAIDSIAIVMLRHVTVYLTTTSSTYTTGRVETISGHTTK